MYSYLQSSLPLSLVEAARIDGSNEFRTFNHIVLPIMKHAIAVQAIFTFVGSWNNYFTPALIIQSNILPDYDNFVKAGEQYNNDAVHINDIVGNFNKMSFELKQSTEHIMDYISNITNVVKEGYDGINLAASNTLELSNDINTISKQVAQNKKVADMLNAQAEHFNN